MARVRKRILRVVSLWCSVESSAECICPEQLYTRDST
jgi:hypothetical protein